MKEVIPYGSHAILINFERRIDPAIHAQVIALKDFLNNHFHQEIDLLVPAYNSLTIRLKHEAKIPLLREVLESWSYEVTGFTDVSPHDLWNIPVCYDDEFAWDREAVIHHTGLSWSEVQKAHTETSYGIYMMGFRPGFAYMGSLPSSLEVPRRATPRTQVMQGSVGLAGLQTGIYPVDAPGGWQIIGRCPFSPFDVRRKNPFLFKVGDQIQFEAIERDEFENLSDQWHQGHLDLNIFHG